MKKTTLIIIAIVFAIFFSINPAQAETVYSNGYKIGFAYDHTSWGPEIGTMMASTYRAYDFRSGQAVRVGKVRVTGGAKKMLHIWIGDKSTKVSYAKGKEASLSDMGYTISFKDMTITMTVN